MAADADAIEVRQAEIEQGDVRLVDRGEVEGLPRRRRGSHAVPPGFQTGRQHPQERGFVVDDEDVPSAIVAGDVALTPDGR